ncbi:hypothetical protein N7454_001124 [Penicillium verhagenii]|nr:hypothetical protein N7454_001124 [Penicillium verhagenii]
MEASKIVPLPRISQDRPPELIVVVLPDFGKDGLPTELSCEWIHSVVPQDGATVQVLRFHYRIDFKSNTSAVSILSDPSLSLRNRKAIDLMAGIIFFGTPHKKRNLVKSPPRVTWLLKHAAKMPKGFLAKSELDFLALVSICEDFEKSDIQAPVLSVYETRPTKLKERFWSTNSEILVDRTLAMTWATQEELLPNDTNHDSVSIFQPQSAIHQEIGLLMRSALSMRRAVTGSARNVLRSADHGDLWASTLSHKSESRDPQSKLSPPEANVGSSIPSSFEHIHSQDPAEYVIEETLPTRPFWEFGPFGHEEEFVGREDILDTIDNCFFPDVSQSENYIRALSCCTISGLGGIGKTQTAIEYAWSRRKLFDAIFVVQADGAANLADSFADLASRLGLLDLADKSDGLGKETDMIVSRSKAMKWLSAPKFANLTSGNSSIRTDKEVPWLLIFDNVEDASLLRDYWPVGSEGCILVTTRDERFGSYLRSQTDIALDRLDTSSGSKLLLRLSYLSDSKINTQDASAILERLDGLPIAIQQVAAYIYRRSMTLKEFLKLYDDSLLERDPSDAADESWSHTIATRWALNDLSNTATTLAQTFACLYPDSIKGSAEELPRVRPFLKDFPEDRFQYIAARNELMKSSLIRLNKETELIRMHRLVQDIVLARMKDAERLETIGFVIKVLLATWPTTSHSFEHEAQNWSIQESLLPHIFRLVEVSGKYHLNELEFQFKRSFVKLLQNGGWYLQERGNFVDGSPLYDLGIKLCEMVPEVMADLRADIAFNLANVASETNQFPACLKYVREHLRLRISLDGGNELPSADTGIAYSSLGLGLLLNGDYEGAVEQCDISLKIYEKRPELLDGSFYPTFPHIHRSLALVGAGRPAEAEDGLIGVLRWREGQYGPDDVESFKFGYVQQCLGLLLARCGRSEESIVAYQKAYGNYRKTVGTRYHRYGAVCGKLAEYYSLLNQFEAADSLFDEAEIAYSSHIHYKPELARHYFILAESYRRREDMVSAQQAKEKSELFYKECVPHHEWRPVTLEKLNSLVAPWVW